MPTRLLVALLVVPFLVAADGPDDADKKERAKLVGTWVVQSVETNGRKVPAEAVKDFEFLFTADTFTRKKGGKAESGAGYKLDPSKSPKWIDMTGKSDGKDQSVPALYELDGDTLTLCFRTDYKQKDGKPNPVQKRPEKLAAGDGSNQVLMVLKREKK